MLSLYRLRLLFLLYLIAPKIFAQQIHDVQINKIQDGIDFVTGSPIEIKQYQFKRPVFSYSISPTSGVITAQVRDLSIVNEDRWTDRGEIVAFDSSSGRTRWTRFAKYGQRRFLQEGDVLLEQGLNKLWRIDPENGKPLWKNKSTAYLIYPKFDLFLGYNYGTTGMNTLHGIALSSGLPIWNRKVPAEYGWDKIDMLDDSTALIAASGLHTLDLVSGRGWDMIRETHATKVSGKLVGMTILGGVAAAAMGGMLIPGNLSDTYTDISSNVLYDGDRIYFAAKNKISCQTRAGERVWDHELNAKLSSKSHIFRDGNVIYMINTGYAMVYGVQPSRLGTPYVAAFDANSGEQLFMKPWEERKEYIVDFLTQGRELLLLYKDKMEIHQLSDKGLADKQVFKMEAKPKMKRFISDFYFQKKDSSYTRMSLDTAHYYVITEDQEVLKLDNDFNLISTDSVDNVYLNYMVTASCIFLGNKEKTVVLDRKSLQAIATFPAPLNSRRFGSKLFFSKKAVLSEIDISKFL